MTSLMSIFDPSSTVLSNWVTIVYTPFFIVCVFVGYWANTSKVQIGFKFLLKKLLMLVFNVKSFSLMSVCVFVGVLLMNIWGMLPYVFSGTSHFYFNFSLALWLWVAGLAIGVIFNLKSVLAHLTPLGCPKIMLLFMVMVEIVSTVIQSLTLALRLMANTMAGHMILALMLEGYNILPCFPMTSPMLMVVVAGFTLFELIVALIQAYVYSFLCYMYWMNFSS